MPTETILIVEDERDLREGLATAFRREGYDVLTAATGPEGRACALDRRPDLVILDVMLPGEDGFEVLRRLRREGLETPVLLLTARGQEIDRVVGLELGADDYVVKPFSLRELLARVKAILRRVRPAGPAGRVRIGESWVDLERGVVRRDGEEPAPLSHYERGILRLLLAAEGEPVDRKEILNVVWGYERFPTTRTVDYHVGRLRQKIEPDRSAPRHILTVHGVGYRLVR